jgi:hypothetical protein
MSEDKECRTERERERFEYAVGARKFDFLYHLPLQGSHMLARHGDGYAHQVLDALWRLWKEVRVEPVFEAAKPAVPEGWKLVPLEPTYGMEYAYEQSCAGEFYIDGYHAMLSAAPPLPVVQGWISVKDRLPDDGQTVAFVVDCKNPNWDHLHGRVLGGLYLGTKNGGFSVPGLTVNASHWMPLPAAPTPPAAPKEPTT